MAKTKVFISFDFEHDRDIKGSLISQSKHKDSPFSINDYSIQFAVPDMTRWQKIAREKISGSDLMIVLCGAHTHESDGVAAEITIAQETKTPYFLLEGRKKVKVHKPRNTLKTDQIRPWNWKQLRNIFMGE